MSIYGIRLPPLQKNDDGLLYFESKNKEEDKEKKLVKYIDNLPDELQRYIFDYIKIELWFQDFKTALESKTSQHLKTCLIRPWIPRILSNPHFTKLCNNKIKHFKTVWEKSKKNNRKIFIKMNKGNSFAFALLMYHYH